MSVVKNCRPQFLRLLAELIAPQQKYPLSRRKQTFDFRFTPNSGRKWVTEFMSESDPQRKSKLTNS
jgi:hypothetical protein